MCIAVPLSMLGMGGNALETNTKDLQLLKGDRMFQLILDLQERCKGLAITDCHAPLFELTR